MSNIEPTPFGDKYVLVEHIATGGMAEVYRANYTGIEGFAKELVVKMLREEFTDQDHVIELFLNEARVAATLTHNNVVHTYDLGEIEGEYYIAMELLKGEELVAVLRKAVQTGQMLPMELSIGIIMQSLEGLHYVHTRKDEHGRSLGLVHRDINPTNVHVGYDGACKVLDFGIAATRASLVAREGEFAGKLSYMPPEQILGQHVDHRSDIFAIGVMLYEMCLGRRLFRGRREEVTQRITEGDVPAPTFVDPDFPPALEAAIMKALEVDPAERYQNCDHMFRDLEAFLQEAGLSWTPRKISALMESMFGEGAPAEVNYDDQYDDLQDEALDFDAYDTLGSDDESAPDWAREAEGGGAGADADGGGKRMTIGSLEQLVTDTGAFRTSGGAAESGLRRQADPLRASGRHKVIPRAKNPTRGKRKRAGDSGRSRRPVTRSQKVARTGAQRSPLLTTGSLSPVGQGSGTSGSTFGHSVVQQEGKKGIAATAWILALLSAAALAYFAWTVFTSK